jgi:hypothetical protein
MENIIVSQRPYKLIPDIIAKDFERMIIESYFDGGWHDLHNLSFHVDTFAVYSASYAETGDPFDYIDDDSRELTNQTIIQCDFNRLMEDVHSMMNKFHLFHAWCDEGQNGQYEYVVCMNMPVIQIW